MVDAVAQDIVSKYKAQVEEMLDAIGLPAESPTGIIFITPDDLERYKAARVVLDEEDHELARSLWKYREDPYGHGPSDERTIPCWAPLV